MEPLIFAAKVDAGDIGVIELGGGARGERDSHVERRLTQLTGAEAAVVVNNNAAAVMLAIAGLARGREAIVSAEIDLERIVAAKANQDVVGAGSGRPSYADSRSSSRIARSAGHWLRENWTSFSPATSLSTFPTKTLS